MVMTLDHASLALVWDTQMSLQVCRTTDGGFGLLPFFSGAGCLVHWAVGTSERFGFRGFLAVGCQRNQGHGMAVFDLKLPRYPLDISPPFWQSGVFLVHDPNHFKVDILRFVAMACWHNFINTWERSGRKIWILEGGSFSSDMVILDLPPVSVWNGSWYCGDNGWDSSFALKEINQKKNPKILCKVKGRQSQF